MNHHDQLDNISCTPITVRIKKNVSQSLGMTLRKDKTGRCIIARIMIGGMIHRYGSLHVGDEIVEINSESVVGDSLEFIQRLLKTAHGQVYLTVTPNYWRDPQNCEIYVRAMFDYEPAEDAMLPESQLGLSFVVGDVLRIISKDDHSWWQAQHLETDVDSPARLIPSCEMQEGRAVSILAADRAASTAISSTSAVVAAPSSSFASKAATVTNGNATSEMDFFTETSALCNPFVLRHKCRQKREERRRRQQAEQQNHHTRVPIVCNGVTHNMNGLSCISNHLNNRQYAKFRDQLHFFLSDLEFSPYEEVVEVAEHRRRTLVLLGAHGVGRRHVKNCLVETCPHMFAAPIPHTTRAPLPNQLNGKDYNFVIQEEMLADIASNLYLEYGRQEDTLYGVKLESVRNIISCQLVPVLDVEPQTLRLLRNAEFCPFVVFISPPDLQTMSDAAREISDGSLERLSEDSDLLETLYRPFIDMEIVNYSIEETVQQIISCLNELHSSPQWIPVTWIY